MSSKRVTFVNRRKRAGLTQQQLANSLGVAVRTVQGWESGDYPPTLNSFQHWRLCVLLKCSAEDLARDFFPDEFTNGNNLAAESPGISSPK